MGESSTSGKNAVLVEVFLEGSFVAVHVVWTGRCDVTLRWGNYCLRMNVEVVFESDIDVERTVVR